MGIRSAKLFLAKILLIFLSKAKAFGIRNRGDNQFPIPYERQVCSRKRISTIELGVASIEADRNRNQVGNWQWPWNFRMAIKVHPRVRRVAGKSSADTERRSLPIRFGRETRFAIGILERAAAMPLGTRSKWVASLASHAIVLVAVAALSTMGQTAPLRRVEFREPSLVVYQIPPADAGKVTDGYFGVPLKIQFGTEWTEAWLDGTTDAVDLGNRVVLQLEPGAALDSLLNGRDLTLARTVKPNLFILQASDSQSAINAAEALAKESGVVASYPVTRRAYRKLNAYAPAPDDPEFGRQWHLENRGSSRNLDGPDLNVRAAWPAARGDGVLVAVADDGIQLDHPDLEARASGAHFNFYRGVRNGWPAASDANHATAVAGLIAAETGNNADVAGVAPGARMSSWVIFGTSFRGRDSIASDEQLMDMFQHEVNRVAVQNHSWGSTSTVQLGIDALSDSGINAAVTEGRDGKGVVIVRAGGNERENLTNSNDDGFASDPRVIAVSAMRKDGRAVSYSSPGACILVAAPSGDVIDTDDDGFPDEIDPDAPEVLTTDRTGRNGYNTDSGETGDVTGFSGTSASSPQIAGVTALILSANPSLTYRDVQQILIFSARHFDFDDPDARLNGAGFRVSHNVGFGVPDAAEAVRLAKNWPNRPPATTLSFTSTTRQEIPDDALRVVVSGADITQSLSSIRCLPSLGLHPDNPTAGLPIEFVGLANEPISRDLHGKGVFIERGGGLFSDKIERAARAGAAFAVIFNNTGSTSIPPLGGTTFVPIPAISIGRNDGEALRAFLADNPKTEARLQLTSAIYTFPVRGALVCEHVGVRLKTTHSRRSDLRVTLVSPSGTRSVLQSINADSSAGPRDWTYWSTQHFYESSVGEWRVEVSDERNTTFRLFGSSTPATGAVTFAQLILKGVAITDSDGDGLDDAWESRFFGGVALGPKDDPDEDGFNNAREHILGTDPRVAEIEFRIDLVELQSGFQRLSWPGREGDTYTVQSRSDSGTSFVDLGSVSGHSPVTEFVVPTPVLKPVFYRVRRQSN